QIELAWPGVARNDRVDTHALTREDHMAFLELLRHGVVAAHVEPDLVDGDSLCIHVLIIAQASEIRRHKSLHHKGPVLCEMGGDVLETAYLVILGQQVE